ncbi:MAG: PAS domain-containing protein [Haloarculaceae archaeon]
MDSDDTARDRPRAVLDRVSEGVLALNDDLVYTYANERAQSLLGMDCADIVGTYIWDLFPEAADSVVADRIETARETDERATYERYNEEHGQWFEAHIYPDENGLTVMFRDITERKEREEQLRRLHDATRELVTAESTTAVAEQTSAAATEILDLEANGVHLYDESTDALAPTAVSSKTRELLGDPPLLDEGVAWEVYQSGESRHYADVREAEALYNEDTELRSELVLPLGDHGVFILSSTTIGAFDEADVRVAELLANSATTALSERAKEQQLRERDREVEQAETLFENAQDAFFVVDVDRENDEYRFERVNPAYESLTGLSDAEMRGQTPRRVFGDDDGTEIKSHYDNCVERKQPISYVEQLNVPEPDSYWDSRIAPVIVDDEVVQIVGATRNITEQKAYETQLEQQRDGLELLNEIVRHDIRNDLQVVASYAELLASRVDEDDREYVERILNNAETAVELTRSARDLSGTMLQTDQSTEPTPLRQTLLRQIDDIRTSYADAVVRIDGEIPSVAVDADEMLSSMFRNILKNAIQHNDKAVPEVTVSVDTSDDTVRVTVTDNGPGIPDAQKEAVFGKGEKGLKSEGTGIGLYLVNTLIEKYGGTIRVDDNEPEGTIVTVTLPHV